MELRFDASIDEEDIAQINWVRYYINAALSRIPDAPQKRSKGSTMISVQSKAIEYQDKIRGAMDKLLFKDRQKSKEMYEHDYRWGHLNKKRYPDIDLNPFNPESDMDSSLKMITSVVFPKKEWLDEAEEIVRQLKNLKRLSNTTVDGVFEAFCPICPNFERFLDPQTAKRHLKDKDHKARMQQF